MKKVIVASWLLTAVAGFSQTEVQALREQVVRQQKRIEALDAALEDLRQVVARALGTPAALDRGPAAPDVPPAPQALAQSESGPEKLRFKNVHLSPIGFVEATAMYRSQNQNADAGSTFGGIPLAGTANSKLSEFHGSARQSRFGLLADGAVGRTKFSGFMEADFLGASVTANPVESNSFPVRLRQFWVNLDLPNGLSFTAGQSWSLLTTHRRGLRVRSEYVPYTIDAQYAVGYNWARQFEVRATKDLGRGMWAAVSLANPETTTAGVVLPSGILGFAGSPNAQSPSSQYVTSATPGAAGVSTERAPDVIAKLVFEPGWGHYELKGVGRSFRARLNGANHTAFGGGIGAAGILPLHPKLDLMIEGLAGLGLGRYASTVGPDVAAAPDGALKTVRAAQVLAGLEFHPAKAWDIYSYYGVETFGRAAFAGTNLGYGSPLSDLSTCTREVPGACPQANRTVWQIQPGFWYRFHQGKEGIAAVGASYSYTRRELWSGLNGLRPGGKENIFMLSMRYYLP